MKKLHAWRLATTATTLSLALAPSLIAKVASAQVQAGLGAFAGTVQDSTQAAVPGAKVVLTNPSIGLRQETVTNAAGSYSFTALTVVGGYTIQVSAPGFSTEQVNNLTSSVGTIIAQNVTLAIGTDNTTVQVEAGSSEQVQVDTSSLSQLIDSTIWKTSPLENRSQNDFVGLVAGAASGSGRGFAINGARGGAGNFMVDGFDNNDQGQGGSGTTFGTAGAVTTISPDAIQEFRVISHIPPAEYGRSGGFTTDTVLRSGTNQFHGSAFEYNRIQALAANDFFSNRAGIQDHLVRNQFGGSFGGPIKRDKTYFFATTEFQRYRQGAPITTTGTTQDFLTFVQSGAFEKFMEGTAQNTGATPFANTATGLDSNGNQAIQVGTCVLNLGSTCPGLFAKSATLGPVFTKLLAAEPGAFPLAKVAATNLQAHVAQGLFTSFGGNGAQDVYYPVPVYGQVTVAQTTATNQERGSMKVDHKLTNSDQLSFTYLIDFENTLVNNAGGGNTIGVGETQVGGSQNFGATYTHTFSPSLLNVFKASYLRHVSNFSSPGTEGVPEEFTADSLGVGFGASAGLPQYFTDTEFAYEDSATKSLGRNTLKGGFRFIRTRNGSQFFNDVSGTLAPWSVEGLTTDGQLDEASDLAFFGAPTYGGLYYASASVDASVAGAPTLPNVYRGFRANEYAAYFQDDIKFSSRLTVNAGIRYEYFSPPHNFQSGIDSNVYYGSATTVTPNGNPNLPNAPFIAAIQGATFQLAQANGRSTIWNRDTNNFAPRFGFSYDTLGNGRVVLRGGFGIGFDRLYNNVYENIRFNSPHFADNTIGFGAGSATPASLTLFPGLYQAPFSAAGGNFALANSGGKPVPRHIDQNLVTAYYEQAHLGVETNILHGYVLETDYVGTFGRKLVGLKDANNYDGRTSCPIVTKPYATGTPCYNATATHLGFSSARPNALFNGDNFRSNAYNSNYNALQVSLRKGFTNGLQILANYTYSKAMDEVSDVFTQRNAATGSTDPLNVGYDYGPADFDQRHIFVFTANYELRLGRKTNPFTYGWGLSPIVRLQSGLPFSVINSSSSYDPNKDGREGSDREVYIGTGSVKNAIIHGDSPAGGNDGSGGYLDLSKFARYVCPANVNGGLWCDPPAQKNELTGPAEYNVDLGVLKHFYLTEKYSFTVAANFFNLLNHPNFNNPTSDGNGSSGISSSAFVGQATSDLGARVTQLSARFDF